jgi:hypothetical protein
MWVRLCEFWEAPIHKTQVQPRSAPTLGFVSVHVPFYIKNYVRGVAPLIVHFIYFHFAASELQQMAIDDGSSRGNKNNGWSTSFSLY